MNQAKIIPFDHCTWEPVIIESPYGSDDPIEVLKNETYLRAVLRFCLLRGQAPFASHGLYTLPGVLDDRNGDQRKRGMKAGFAVAELFKKRIFFTQRGISSGMVDGANEARKLNQTIESEIIPNWGEGGWIDMELWMVEKKHWTLCSSR